MIPVSGNPFVVHCKREVYDVYIGRPSKWGNQFVIGVDGTREEVILLYKVWLNQWLHNRPDHLETLKTELRGKILGCWCAPLPCHGDVLAEIANSVV